MQGKKWIWAATLCVVGAIAGCTTGGDTATGADTIRVGVVQIMEHQALDAANRGLTDALKEADLDRPVEILQQNAQGDQANLKTIAQGFVSQKVDLIAAISTPAAQVMANETTTIPIVGTAITDYEAAKLVHSNDAPGTNVTGTRDAVDAASQVELLRELLPAAGTVGVLYNSGEINSQLQVEAIRKAAEAAGLKVVEATVTNVNDLQQVARALTTEVDVIYVPTDNVVASGMATLTAATDAANIPVVGAAETYIADGAVAALSVDYYNLGKIAGEMAVKILQGKADPKEMAIKGEDSPKVRLNEEALGRLGIAVPESVRVRAPKS